jgi:hypothetical protein
MVKDEKPLCKENYLSRMYKAELEYINKIILFQDYHYTSCGEVILLIDDDFPEFRILTDKKIGEIIYLYEQSGWKIRKERLNDRKEFLLVFS